MLTEIIYLLIAFLCAAILGKIMIPVLRKLKVGQSERLDGPRTHLKKQGTPTMGGIIMIITIIVFVIIATCLNPQYANVILPTAFASIGFGLVGFIDDFKKVILKNTDGISPKMKLLGQLIISAVYVLILEKYVGLGTDIQIPIINYNLNLPVYFYIPFMILVMLGATNAVNLTDGVDGLAGSVSIIMVGTLSIIAFQNSIFGLSIFGSIVCGAIGGFLIYNFHKAKVMMGDTGSLLLGGVISSMAIYMKNPLILLIVAFIPIIETLSVILQVLSFRFTGKRMFKMAPLHHHFELTGWRENKVVFVFSMITLLMSVIAILV